MCGQALLADPSARPLFVRLGRTTSFLYSEGIRPRCDDCNYIEWRARQYNCVADHLCNTMDWRSSAQDIDSRALAAYWAKGCCIHVYSDGGLRRVDSAAIGWAVYCVTRCNDEPLWTLVAWRSTYIEACAGLTSFQLEATVLEDIMRCIQNVLGGKC